MGLVAFHPFLLGVMGRKASDQTDRDRIAVIMESYLVRRMICNADTRGYSTLCIGLLNALDDAGDNEPASENIRLLLAHSDSKVIQWPDDVSFEREWLRRQFYGSIRRDRVAMILQAIEEHYHKQDTKAEPIAQFDYQKLQIEHIMPQKWQTHWPVNGGEEAVHRRDAKINTIGNLTLVSDKLNPSLSNAPWLEFRQMKKGSVLVSAPTACLG